MSRNALSVKNRNYPWKGGLPSSNLIGPIAVFMRLNCLCVFFFNKNAQINTQNDRFSFVTLRLLGTYTIQNRTIKFLDPADRSER